MGKTPTPERANPMWSRQDAFEWDDMVGLSADAIALFSMARSKVGHDGTGGVVSLRLARGILGSHALDESAMKELERSGWWHTSRLMKSCDDCCGAKPGPLGDGWYIHKWLTDQFSAEAQRRPDAKRAELRVKRLHSRKNNSLKEQVIARDRGLCRYCRCRPKFGDQKTVNGATFDHVDPGYYGGEDGHYDGKDDGNVIWNLALACRGCNSKKNGDHLEDLHAPGEVEGVVLLTAAPATRSPLGPWAAQVMAPPIDRSAIVEPSSNEDSGDRSATVNPRERATRELSPRPNLVEPSFSDRSMEPSNGNGVH